jgi:hypothetical protein
MQSPRYLDQNHRGTQKKQTPLVSVYYGFWNTPRAATTLPAAGLVVSTFDFAVLLLVAGAVFLLARDFFSMAIVDSPVLFNCFTHSPSASREPNSIRTRNNRQVVQNKQTRKDYLPAMPEPAAHEAV